MSLPVAHEDGETTIGEVLNDLNVRAVLGTGDNMLCRISGIEMTEDAVFCAGSQLFLETRSNKKA